MLIRLLFFILCFWSMSTFGQAGIYAVKSGQVNFSSEAPKELISASSKKLKGILDIEKRTFAFIIDIVSFTGFNNTLQREHFNENYLESNLFAAATYKGKIIEDIDLSKDGTYSIRTKGKLNIHGIEQERIIKVLLVVKKGKISASGNFPVALTDHDIKIPRVMNDKLSPEIQVAVQAIFQAQAIK